MSDKQSILEAVDNRQPVAVSVPEWPAVGTVFLLPMTGDELDAYDQVKSDKMWPIEKDVEADWRGLRSLVVSLHMCDEHGSKFSFTDMERRELGRKSCKVLDRIYRKCCEISGLTASAIKDAEKNLEGDQTESSGSSSP